MNILAHSHRIHTLLSLFSRKISDYENHSKHKNTVLSVARTNHEHTCALTQNTYTTFHCFSEKSPTTTKTSPNTRIMIVCHYLEEGEGLERESRGGWRIVKTGWRTVTQREWILYLLCLPVWLRPPMIGAVLDETYRKEGGGEEAREERVGLLCCMSRCVRVGVHMFVCLYGSVCVAVWVCLCGCSRSGSRHKCTRTHMHTLAISLWFFSYLFNTRTHIITHKLHVAERDTLTQHTHSLSFSHTHTHTCTHIMALPLEVVESDKHAKHTNAPTPSLTHTHRWTNTQR